MRHLNVFFEFCTLPCSLNSDDMKRLFIILGLAGLFAACGENKINPLDFNVLSNLPIDTGGVHLAKIHESTSAPYGHYIYTPSSYSKDGPEFPLLIFFDP